MVRDEDKASSLKSFEINIVYGNYNNYNSILNAFSGIDKLLFISSGDIKNRSKQHLQVVKAAKKSKVKHIFYTSQDHKTDDKTSAAYFIMKSHLDTENAIMKSGMDYTILRNGVYLDMLPLFLENKVIDNGIYLPAGNGKIAFALRDEMSEVAANLLNSTGHKNKIYNITGKGVSFLEIATMIYQITNKNITYFSPNLDTYLKTAVISGIPRESAKILGSLAVAAQQGEFEGKDSIMETFLARKPVKINEYLKKMYN